MDMTCPHCSRGIHLAFSSTKIYEFILNGKDDVGCRLDIGHCPSCKNLIVLLAKSEVLFVESPSKTGDTKLALAKEGFTHTTLFPQFITRHVEPEVPEQYRVEFLEACAVLSISPKSSAALSRRILQSILRNEHQIRHKYLSTELDAFLNLPNVPPDLKEIVDAVRHYGNFAAHEIEEKDNPGTIIDVEPEEAEWCIDIIEALFDFTFVEPKRREAKKNRVREKIDKSGKDKMKQ